MECLRTVSNYVTSAVRVPGVRSESSSIVHEAVTEHQSLGCALDGMQQCVEGITVVVTYLCLHDEVGAKDDCHVSRIIIAHHHRASVPDTCHV